MTATPLGKIPAGTWESKNQYPRVEFEQHPEYPAVRRITRPNTYTFTTNE